MEVEIEVKKVDNKAIDQLVRKFYSVSVLAHVEHINTKSFAQHEALGDFYSKVNSMKDRVIEYLIGSGYMQKISVPILEMGSGILAESGALADMFCKCSEDMDDDALENMAGEFEESVGKLKFLYRLS
jgi:hypothetical protein